MVARMEMVVVERKVRSSGDDGVVGGVAVRIVPRTIVGGVAIEEKLGP